MKCNSYWFISYLVNFNSWKVSTYSCCESHGYCFSILFLFLFKYYNGFLNTNVYCLCFVYQVGLPFDSAVGIYYIYVHTISTALLYYYTLVHTWRQTLRILYASREEVRKWNAYNMIPNNIKLYWKQRNPANLFFRIRFKKNEFMKFLHHFSFKEIKSVLKYN